MARKPVGVWDKKRMQAIAIRPASVVLSAVSTGTHYTLYGADRKNRAYELRANLLYDVWASFLIKTYRYRFYGSR
jgi:hypothetical protein